MATTYSNWPGETLFGVSAGIVYEEHGDFSRELHWFSDEYGVVHSMITTFTSEGTFFIEDCFLP